MSIEVDADLLQDCAGDSEIQTYSGRGMNNKECVGLVADDTRDFLRFIKEIAYAVLIDEDTELEPFYDQIERVEADGMGTSVIYYWPGVTAVDIED